MDKDAITEQFQQYRVQAIDWYRAREPREQLVMRILAVVLTISLVWFLLLAPLKTARDQAKQRWVSAEQTLQWIASNRDAVQAARSRSGVRQGSGDWISNLNAGAASHQVTLKGYTPEGSNSVRILLEDQALSNVMVWLQNLQNEQGVSPATIEISEGSRQGSVNVRATLERGV